MLKIWSKQLLYGILPEADEDPYILIRRKPIMNLNASAGVPFNYYNTPQIIANTLSGEEG